ncbi:DUF6884 domain-containing protein [Photobacterium kagoshimensis]|uniref:DUF6884 domain-containing protein n=1 Tax=Photobacterium kagoshimensis TaxID=2910242 RepID=UPI003D097A36
MKTIFLISCVSKKKDIQCMASELYISPLFKLNYEFATKQNPAEIYILSAEYGLVTPYEQIEPYDKTLNNMKNHEIQLWADKVLHSLKKLQNIDNCKFIILAGERYRRHLTPELKHYNVPLKGLTIGKQLQKLKVLINDGQSVA